MEYHFLELPKYADGKKLEKEISKWLFAIKNGEKFINEPATPKEFNYKIFLFCWFNA